MTHSYSAPSEEIHKCKWLSQETKALQWLQDTAQTSTSRPGERIARWRLQPFLAQASMLVLLFRDIFVTAVVLLVARFLMQILQKEISILLASAVCAVLFLSSPSHSLWSCLNQDEMAHRQRFYAAGNPSSPTNIRNKGKCHGLSSWKRTHTHTHSRTHFWKRREKGEMSLKIRVQDFFFLAYVITPSDLFFLSYSAMENKSRLWIEFCYHLHEHDTQTHCQGGKRKKNP